MIHAPLPEDTENLGIALASSLHGKRVPAVVALRGELGAGKSVFARAFVRYFLPEADVPSPTFTLVQPYQPPDGALPVWHFDLYRLKSPEELVELGWDEALRGIVLVEWPERAGDFLPDDRIDVDIVVAPDGERLVGFKFGQ
ncbi:hypothetical protein FACS1894186_6970 [Alphaproteobacteria bacterium]|nr:hypothetical protein FACS1894186_6970 [Alphaproteobacteria bacterium]